MKMSIVSESTQKKHHSVRKTGFTVVELLIVIIVIAVLATLVGLSYIGISNSAVASSMKSDLTRAYQQIVLDQTVNHTYPTTLSAADGGNGISASSGTSFTYAANNNTTPKRFCIQATNGSQNFTVTNNSSVPIEDGDCLSYGLDLSLDVGNTSSYPGSGTAWYDLSGVGNNGTLVNGVGYTSSNGGALVFDGSNDYADFGNNLESSGAFSVASWHKRTTKDTVNADSIAGNWYWNATLDSRRGWVLRYYLNSDNLLFLTETTNGANVQEMSASYATTVGNWYFAVGVFDPTDRTIKLYVDGVLRGTATAPVGYTQVAYDSPYTMQAGYNAVNSGYFTGQISDIRIYNRALSAAEIQHNFDITRSRYGK